jgi:hypothetical protein
MHSMLGREQLAVTITTAISAFRRGVLSAGQVSIPFFWLKLSTDPLFFYAAKTLLSFITSSICIAALNSRGYPRSHDSV